jgi:hypothetical protein
MKSNKDLTPKEFEISVLLKRAMMAREPGAMQTFVRSALRILHSE